MPKIKYKIYTLGCKVNQSDSDEISGKLIGMGLVKVDKNADLVVINSCVVTKNAIQKNKRIIKISKVQNPKSKIILIGCWPRIYKIKNEISGLDFICLEKEPEKIIKQIIKKFLAVQRVNAEVEIKNLSKVQENYIKFNKNKSRYFLKIQDGCNQFCSYCIIPLARGNLKSKAKSDVIKEIKEAINAGYKEIVLCGIHLGLYGYDLKPDKEKINLAGLLEKIIKIKNLGRLRLSSIEVTEIEDGLIRLIAENNKICKHLHIPLQAGCNKILKLMKRPYTTNLFIKKIKEIRKHIPDIAITTDVITGFPEENNKDFLATCKFIKRIKFSRLHVFPFSAHEKTLAANMKNQVSQEIKKVRATELRKTGKILQNNFKQKFIGHDLNLLIEKKDGKKIVGKSEYYFDVESDMKRNDKVGNIVKRKF
jgi:threonylcarbamoyladenosine tRNA methylthiotransferase MtaB